MREIWGAHVQIFGGFPVVSVPETFGCGTWKPWAIPKWFIHMHLSHGNTKGWFPFAFPFKPSTQSTHSLFCVCLNFAVVVCLQRTSSGFRASCVAIFRGLSVFHFRCGFSFSFSSFSLLFSFSLPYKKVPFHNCKPKPGWIGQCKVSSSGTPPSLSLATVHGRLLVA